MELSKYYYKYRKYKQKYINLIQYGGNNLPKYTDEETLNKLRKLCYDLDKLFVDNNIMYWMDAGTLLGAIRHQDIVPWDDDVDLCIIEDDFNKLLSLKDKLKDLGYETSDWKGIFKIFPINGEIVKNVNYKYIIQKILLNQ